MPPAFVGLQNQRTVRRRGTLDGRDPEQVAQLVPIVDTRFRGKR